MGYSWTPIVQDVTEVKTTHMQELVDNVKDCETQLELTGAEDWNWSADMDPFTVAVIGDGIYDSEYDEFRGAIDNLDDRNYCRSENVDHDATVEVADKNGEKAVDDLTHNSDDDTAYNDTDNTTHDETDDATYDVDVESGYNTGVLAGYDGDYDGGVDNNRHYSWDDNRHYGFDNNLESYWYDRHAGWDNDLHGTFYGGHYGYCTAHYTNYLNAQKASG